MFATPTLSLSRGSALIHHSRSFPGIIGVIDAVGDGVTAWRVGDRVGVGFLGGQDNECDFCRRGDFVNCTNQPWTGTTVDGGCAEYTFARTSGLVRIPDGLGRAQSPPSGRPSRPTRGRWSRSVFYVGPDGLIRRHDYTAEVVAGVPAAHYTSDYREFHDIVVPTTRRVYPIAPDGGVLQEPLLVSVDLDEIAFG